MVLKRVLRLGRERFSFRLLFLLFLVTGILWRSPEAATSLGVYDALEYAITAANFAAGEGLTFTLYDQTHPTRYPPGFPVLFLAAWYLVTSSPLGIGIYSVLACSLGTVVLVWSLCKTALPGRLGEGAAVLAVSLLLSLHHFYWLSQELMADIPILFVSLAALLACVCGHQQRPLAVFAIGGIATGVALLMRLTNLALCLPFLFFLVDVRPPAVLIRRALGLLIPLVSAGGILLFYNFITFGDSFSSGYQYWIPHSHLQLSISNIETSVAEMLHPFNAPHRRTSFVDWCIGPLALLLPVVFAALCRKYRPVCWQHTSPALLFLVLAGLPIVVFFALWPFASARFVLFLHVVWLTLGVIWATSLLDKRSPHLLWLAVCFALVCLLVSRPLGGTPQKSSILTLLEDIDAGLPHDAVLIGAMNDLRADHFFVHGSLRRFMPLSPYKSFEYWKVGKHEQPRQSIGVCSAFTCPEQIEAFLKAGRRVYLATQLSRQQGQSQYVDRVLERFRWKPVDHLLRRDAIVELGLKTATKSATESR